MSISWIVVQILGLKHRPLFTQSVAVLVLIITFAPIGWTQVMNTGNFEATPAPGRGHSYIGLLNETVNPSNGSVNLRIDVPTPTGRGVVLPFHFDYNSNGVIRVGPGGQPGQAGISGNADQTFAEQGGWRYGLPVLSTGVVNLPSKNPQYPNAVCPVNTGILLTDPTGSRHPTGLAIANQTECNTLSVTPVTVYSGGDRFYRVWTQNGAQTVQVPFYAADSSGTLYHFPALLGLSGCSANGSACAIPDYIEDRNGNQITLTQSNTSSGFPVTVTDTVGRALLSIPAFGTSGSTVSVAGLGASFTVNWGTAGSSFAMGGTTLGTSAYCSAFAPQWSTYGGAEPIISTLVLPNQQSYQFYYDPTYGLLNKIVYPTGAYIRYVWQPNVGSDRVTYPDSNTSGAQGTCVAKFNAPAIMHRYVSYDGTTEVQQQDFTYSTTWSTSGPFAWTSKQTIVTTTDLSKTGHPSFQTTYVYQPWAIGDPPNVVSTLADQVPQEQTVTYMDWSGTTLKTVTKTWSSVDFIASQQVALGPIGSGTQTSKTVYTYPPEDYRGSCPQPSQVDDYDFGLGAPGSLLRSVATAYQMLTTPLGTTDVCTPSSVIIYGGGGSRAAETDYAYDQTATSPVSAIQHDNANYPSGSGVIRGNVTTKTQKCFVGSNTCPDSVTTYGYDQTGQVLSMKDPCGNGSCTDMTGTTHTTNYLYSDSYTVLSNGSNVSYTPSGNTNAYPTQITDPLGHIQNFTYDFNNGQLTISKDNNRLNTTYIYNDLFDRPTQVSYPDGGQTETAYSDAGPSPSITACQLINGTAGAACIATSPPTGWKVTLATMDGVGHVVQTQLVSDPDGPTYSVTSYDGTGRPYQVYNPTRCNPPTTNCSEATWGITTYTYDALGRTQQVAKPDGSTVSTAYPGNQSTVTDEAGNQHKIQNDSLGRLTYAWEAPNITGYNYETDYVYDPLSNPLSINQKGGSSNSANWRTRTFGYDSRSRLTSAINPESGTITYSYDLNSNLSTKIAPKAGQTGTQLTTHNYTYDALNRILTEANANPSSANAQYGYDGVALTSGCGQSPPTIVSAYPIGRRTATCGQRSGTSWSFDQMGRPLLESTRNLGSTQKVLSVNYTYNLDGSINTLTYPSGDVLTYTVGGAGRVTKVTDASNNYVLPHSACINCAVADEEYRPFGGLGIIYLGTTATSGSGIYRLNTYNSRLQLASLELLSLSHSDVLRRTYDFHLGSGDNGNLFGIQDSVNAIQSTAFTYDPLNRLQQANTTATSGAGCWGEVYTIDPWGNLTNRAGVANMGSCSTEGLSATATTKNQLSGIGLQYDAAGNVTNDGNGNTLTYDAENRVATFGGFTYYYDADGTRMEKSSGSSGTMYWLGISGETLAETDLTGTINEEYVYFNGQRIARVDRPSGAVHYSFSDHLGSASVITDPLGNAQQQYYYYPYGGLVSSSGSDPNHYKFTGKERDAESGLDMFGARYYGSSLGRFMTPDWATNPAAVPYASFGNPQSLNLYSYVKNNPATLTDPNGHCDVDVGNGKTEHHWGWCIWHSLGFYQTQLDIQQQADKARANLSSMNNWFIQGQSASEWAKSASNKDVIAMQRQIVDGLRDETWANVWGQAGPVSLATVLLPTPGGMGTADFGQKVMKWGTGDDAARARIQTLTREELENSGVTKEMAQQWRDFYKQVSAANPGNPSATGRAELMQRAFELLGGK